MAQTPFTELAEFSDAERNRLAQIEAAPYAPEAWPVAGSVARAVHERAIDETARTTRAQQSAPTTDARGDAAGGSL